MSGLEPNEGKRVNRPNVIQYAANEINGLDIKDTIGGTKRISNVARDVNEAYWTHEAEKDKISDNNDGKNPIVTGAEIEQDVKKRRIS